MPTGFLLLPRSIGSGGHSSVGFRRTGSRIRMRAIFRIRHKELTVVVPENFESAPIVDDHPLICDAQSVTPHTWAGIANARRGGAISSIPRSTWSRRWPIIASSAPFAAPMHLTSRTCAAGAGYPRRATTRFVQASGTCRRAMRCGSLTVCLICASLASEPTKAVREITVPPPQKADCPAPAARPAGQCARESPAIRDRSRAEH